MRKSIALTFLLFTYLLTLHAQEISKKSILDESVNPGAIINELRLPPPKTIGSFFLNDGWQQGNITLTTGIKITSIPLKYDIENKRLEILLDNNIKICENKLIDEFNWKDINGEDTFFHHCRKYSTTTHQCNDDIYQLLYESKKIKLFKNVQVIVKEPDYVPTLDMGNKNRTIVKKENYFLVKNELVQPISYKKKENIFLFGDKSDQVLKFIKKNRLKYRSENDIISIVQYFSNLK